VGESLDSSQTASESESRVLEGLRPTFRGRGGGGVSRSGASFLQELSSAVSVFLFAPPPFFMLLLSQVLMCPRFHSRFYSGFTRVTRVAYSYSHERACIEPRQRACIEP
jgi:hypothetical protein